MPRLLDHQRTVYRSALSVTRRIRWGGRSVQSTLRACKLV